MKSNFSKNLCYIDLFDFIFFIETCYDDILIYVFEKSRNKNSELEFVVFKFST